MTGTAAETIALNSLSLFTCTTVRWRQQLHANMARWGRMSNKTPITVRKCIQRPGQPLLSLSLATDAQLATSVLILLNK